MKWRIKKFRDWRLRTKWLSVSTLLVIGITGAILTVFWLNVDQLRSHAIPDQRLVLSLSGHTYDYLSEVREFLIEGNDSTLSEIREIETDLLQLTDEYRTLNLVNHRQELEVAQRIRQRIDELFETARRIIAIEVRLQEIEPDGSVAEARQELSDTLEELEDIEELLGLELEAAARLAENEVTNAIGRLLFSVVVAGLLGLIVGSLAAIWMSNQVNRSVRELRQAALRIADGELEVRAPITTGDELGELGESFNELASEIQQLVARLEQNLQDLRSTQAQLIQSGKLVAVGELAAGVAHELNNPLSVVLTYSMLLQEKLELLPEEAHDQVTKIGEQLDLMQSSAQRCKKIVDNLLLFSRQNDSEMSEIDIEDLLARTFDLIGSQLKKQGVQVGLDIEPGLPSLHGNFSQLQQVVTNLSLNAMQAMASGGELSVTTRSHDGECELSFADQGTGIPAEHLERIFEPFFTTKAIGEGTGLGLSIALGIVQAHGGRLTVDSVLGCGTTFRMSLPFSATPRAAS